MNASFPTIGLGRRSVSRIGYGAMRITGPEIWGPPANRAEILNLLRRLPELGINFIDTSNSYGPDISEELIREALHPYQDIFVATKGGLVRATPEERWLNGRPEHLIAAARRSCDKLGVSRINLWQLHRIDHEVPADEQFSAIASMLNEGIIENAGLCEVKIDEIVAAQKYFRVCSVQNRLNILDRRSEPVMSFCSRQGIAFIPWYPLRGGELANNASPLAELASRKGVTPAQIALAFLLQLSPWVLPIAGTSQVAHLIENSEARHLVLSREEMAALRDMRLDAENVRYGRKADFP